MEANTAKRRKISHGGTGPSFPTRATSTSASSAFVEATQELLDDVQVDYAHEFEGVDQTLRQFKETIESLDTHDAETIGNVTSSFEKREKITIPYPRPRPGKDSPYKLSFAKPEQVNVVGSYQLRTMARSQSDLGIDMIVVMPASIFQEKDFRDQRYFVKRAYYLAYLTVGLRKAFSSSHAFNFDYLHGNDLLPVTVAKPKSSKGDKKRGYAIRIVPCAPENLFPSSKLFPANNNTKGVAVPAPLYNSTLRAESLFSPYLRLLNSTAASCTAYRDACILGKLWLQQRGLDSTSSGGGFGSAEWNILVALLLQGGGRKGEAVLSSSLNSSQIFRAVIQYLASTNFQKKPIVFGSLSHAENIRQNGPVLYDAAREHNVLFKMTPWSGNFLQQHAKWSLASLKSDSVDQFDPLFLVRVDQALQTFDLITEADLPAEAEPSGLAEKLYRTLRRALGDRAQLVHLILPKQGSWAVTAKSPRSVTNRVRIGIIIDPSHASQKMDLGPSVEQKAEAAKYQEFWGDKAELRRFQDGSILESVEWDIDSEMSVPEQIIRYSIKKHLSLEEDSLHFYSGSSFAKIAHLSNSDAQYFAAARKGFEQLEHEIRELDDLPLHVRQIAPTCPELSYSSLHPPAPGGRLPLDVIISFEASGKWTDNISANQRLKLAFLLKLGSSLSESNPEIKTHVGLDQVEHGARNLGFLDIVCEDGFTFRVRVQTDIEEKALETQLKNKQLERHVHAEAAESLSLYKRVYTNLPLHTQTIQSFSTRFLPLSDTIRLLKYWFSCHKLASHFNEELLELFALRAFLSPAPWQTPTSAMTGFLRSLHLLSRWDWPEEPLIIDHAESISASERSAIEARFHESRRQDPRYARTVLFVATSHDASGTAYSRPGPSRVVANQMTKLARSAVELVRAKDTALDPRSLFQSSLRHYDLLIRLNPKILRGIVNENTSKRSHFKNLDALKPNSTATATPLVEHPSKTLLRTLGSIYSNALVFFHGGDDDAVIAGLWNPELGKRTRKVDLPCAYRPVANGEDTEEEGTLEVDRRSIIAEIARIGGDLVEKIEARDA